MKTYVITLSKKFMVGHPKEGKPTDFKEKFLRGEKIHTIRHNYPLWEKRIAEVQRGEAQLSIRQWSGKPYCSKQELIKNLTKDDGVGIEKYCANFPSPAKIGNKVYHLRFVASNDGLSLSEWCDWFNEVKDGEPLAIIHFTRFRYNF